VSVLFNKLIRAGLLVAAVFGLSACTSTAPRSVAPSEIAAVTDSTDAELSVLAIPQAAADAFERSLAAMEAQRWPEALQELEALVLQYPIYAGPFVNLAIVYRQEGRDEEAESALEMALEIAPNHPAANNQLGMLLRERGEFSAAEAAYRSALVETPDYALAHYNLGVLLDLYMQRSDEALGSYERYQTLSGEPDAAVALWVADLRRRLGMPSEQAQLAREDDL